MKKFLLILCFLTFAISASAQYAELPGQSLSYKNGKLWDGKEKITKGKADLYFSDLNGVDRSVDYTKYRAGYKAGLGLIIGGSSLTVAGALVTGGAAVTAIVLAFPAAAGADPSIFDGVHVSLVVGSASFITGVAALVSGIPTICVYKKKLKNLGYDYNSYQKVEKSSEVQLTFGSQRSGVGFALNF